MKLITSHRNPTALMKLSTHSHSILVEAMKLASFDKTPQGRFQFGLTPVTRSHGAIDAHFIEFEHQPTVAEVEETAEREMLLRFGNDLVDIECSPCQGIVTERPIYV